MLASSYTFCATKEGELVNFVLTRANVDDRQESVIDTLTEQGVRQTVRRQGIYLAIAFRTSVGQGVHIVTGAALHMKQRLMPLYDKIMLRKGASSSR